ncbi:MAG: hypothetical protein CMO55_26775 [Verrucomicrobiales bacterium]|nr:hypothetical protein [Verrucomicrobiales bacterium]
MSFRLLFFSLCIASLGWAGCKDKPEPAPAKPTEKPEVEPAPELETPKKPESPKNMKPPSDPKDKDFIGKTEEAAGKLAKKRGLKSRVVERDGQMLPATRDYRVDRVNFTVMKGKVTKVSRG